MCDILTHSSDGDGLFVGRLRGNIRYLESTMSKPNLLTAAALVFALVALVRAVPGSDKPRAIPAPAVDEPAGDAASETAVLAGGCFWGVQGVYQHVKGVLGAV